MKAILSCLSAFLLLAAPSSQAGSTPSCKPSLSQCPMKGCAKDAPSALVNILKHGHELSGDPLALTFADFASLQDQLEQRFAGKYATLNKPARARLRNFTVSNGTVSEGDFVEIVGYIAAKPTAPHANTGESVNCFLTKPPNNDFHINLTPQPNDTEYHGIVVEMIPQDRNPDWTEKRLKAVQKANLKVRVRGQLLLDNHHKVNTAPPPPGKTVNQPRRFSLFEVHPVQSFEVCVKGQCGSGSAGWEPLEEWKQAAGKGNDQ